MTSSRRVMLVVGARPNFMKVAPVHDALRAQGVKPMLVHTGQHYDTQMSRLFFEELDIPEPDVNLEVGSGSHAVQTAEIMRRFEPVLLEHQPQVVVVVGDVNSTVACSLAAKKIPGIEVAHVEAGLRSFDRSMPEEINRVVTDTLSDLLFTSEPSATRNLLAEGIPPGKIHFVGNVMIDTLLRYLDRARTTGILDHIGLRPHSYALLTLHRPSNVDDPVVFSSLLDGIARVARRLPVLFPVHPRTRPALEDWLATRSEHPSGLLLTQPLGYLEFLHLMSKARVVITDSGGVQDETTVLGIPCLTVRDTTERPITVEIGTNVLVGRDVNQLERAVDKILSGSWKAGRLPAKWDGHAADRIATIISRHRQAAAILQPPPFQPSHTHSRLNDFPPT